METTARGDVPKTLQTIAYISIPDSADLEFLLWDLQDAIAAYAQLSGTALPRPVDLGVDDAGAVDGIVLAVDDALDDEAMIAVEQILDRFGGTGTRVYAVIRAAQEGAEQARGAAVRLHKACERQGQLWCGGVVICAGSGIAALRRSPRMGLLRRPFRRPWTSSWAPFAWGVPSNTRRSSVAQQRAAPTPTAWYAPSLHCPHRSGTPL